MHKKDAKDTIELTEAKKPLFPVESVVLAICVILIIAAIGVGLGLYFSVDTAPIVQAAGPALMPFDPTNPPIPDPTGCGFQILPQTNFNLPFAPSQKIGIRVAQVGNTEVYYAAAWGDLGLPKTYVLGTNIVRMFYNGSTMEQDTSFIFSAPLTPTMGIPATQTFRIPVSIKYSVATERLYVTILEYISPAYTCSTSIVILYCYTNAGVLDYSFGIGGSVVINYPLETPFGQLTAGNMVIGVDSIFVSGIRFSSQHGYINKYNFDGTLDTTWGTAGQATTATQNPYQAVGEPVIVGSYIYLPLLSTAGSAVVPVSSFKVWVVRFRLATGAVDTTWGTSGYLQLTGKGCSFSDDPVSSARVPPTLTYIGATDDMLVTFPNQSTYGVFAGTNIAIAKIKTISTNGGQDSAFGTSGYLFLPFLVGLTTVFGWGVYAANLGKIYVNVAQCNFPPTLVQATTVLYDITFEGEIINNPLAQQPLTPEQIPMPTEIFPVANDPNALIGIGAFSYLAAPMVSNPEAIRPLTVKYCFF